MSAPATSIVVGWRLAQPRVTLLASAFFVEWALPTYTPAAASSYSNSKSFTPPAGSLCFTVEWKAASSLESTKLDYKSSSSASPSSSSPPSSALTPSGDEDPGSSSRCCLIPIEWSEEDVVLRLSFRFTEPVLLPDGSKTPTATIFDGERCIIRAKRADAMPLLRLAVQERELKKVGLPPTTNISAAQILRAHPALVDAFSLVTVRRPNDVTVLDAGPWLGDRKVLLDDGNECEDGASNENDDHEQQRETNPRKKKQLNEGNDPMTSKRYEGCAVLNGIKLDIWEAKYRRGSNSNKINFGFFGPTNNNNGNNNNNNNNNNGGGAVMNNDSFAAATGGELSPQPKAPTQTSASSSSQSTGIVSSHSVSSSVASHERQTRQQKQQQRQQQPQQMSEAVAATAALMSSEEKHRSFSMTATFSRAGVAAAAAAASGSSPETGTNDGETNQQQDDDDDQQQQQQHQQQQQQQQDDDNDGEREADDVGETVGGEESSTNDGGGAPPEPSQPLSDTARGSGGAHAGGAATASSSTDAQEKEKQRREMDEDDYLGEDSVVFLAAHDGLDDLNMFENRKLTTRLNPVNILRALFEEWLSRDNLVIVVCGSFLNGNHAISVAEQLIRYWDQHLAKQMKVAAQASGAAGTTTTAAGATATVLRDPCGYTRPRILCTTFASNPPRLSVADASGRLKLREVPIIRAQNHFLHVAPIIEAPIVAPDDVPSVEASANSRRSRSLEFVDYFLGECAGFGIAPDRTSIVLESCLERQNSYETHSLLMTAVGTATTEAVNPVFAVTNAAAAAATIGTSHNNSEAASAASFESPYARAVMDETSTSSSFTPLDLISNLPDLTRDRNLISKGLPTESQSQSSSSSSSLHAPTLLSAFETALQLHLVAAAMEETVADAHVRCEPVITRAEVKPTRLRLAELTLTIEGTNLGYPRHVVLRDSAISRDVVFPRTEVEVEIRERSKGGFDGFLCKVHPAALLRFLNYDATLPQSNSELAAAAAAKMMAGGGGGGGGNLFNDSAASHPVINNSFRRGSPPKHSIKRLCSKFDVCLWADNGCAAFVDVVAPLPDAILPWMPGSGSWTSQQAAFVAPPVELISNAARLHAWGSFSSSQAGVPCPGTDMPRRLLKGFEFSAVAIAAVAPPDGGSNFFSRALRSAKGKLATDPLTMVNAPAVPASLKLQTTDALLKDLPSPSASASPAQSAARASLLLSSSNNPKALRGYLEPTVQTLPWLGSGTDYADRVFRSAHLLSIPLQRGWFAGGSSAAASQHQQRSSQAATPVVEALIWHHVVTLLGAGGTRIQESVTEITLKSFVESVGHIVIKHDFYSSKKESDGEHFFIDVVGVYTVCLVHELRAVSTGTTLVICTGESKAGTTSISNTVQTAAPAIRHPTLPLAFVWVVDLYPQPDVVADALALFPNVALLFVATPAQIATGRETDLMRLSSTTHSIIRAQRTQGHPSEDTSFCRHQQWLVLNKIDQVAVPPPIPTSSSSAVAALVSDLTAANDPSKQRQLFAARAVDARVQIIRDQFERTACPALRSWNAGDSLLCVATDPESATVSGAEVSELRVQALEVLQMAVKQIAVW